MDALVILAVIGPPVGIVLVLGVVAKFALGGTGPSDLVDAAIDEDNHVHRERARRPPETSALALDELHRSLAEPVRTSRADAVRVVPNAAEKAPAFDAYQQRSQALRGLAQLGAATTDAPAAVADTDRADDLVAASQPAPAPSSPQPAPAAASPVQTTQSDKSHGARIHLSTTLPSVAQIDPTGASPIVGACSPTSIPFTNPELTVHAAHTAPQVSNGEAGARSEAPDGAESSPDVAHSDGAAALAELLALHGVSPTDTVSEAQTLREPALLTPVAEKVDVATGSLDIAPPVVHTTDDDNWQLAHPEAELPPATPEAELVAFSATLPEPTSSTEFSGALLDELDALSVTADAEDAGPADEPLVPEFVGQAPETEAPAYVSLPEPASTSEQGYESFHAPGRRPQVAPTPAVGFEVDDTEPVSDGVSDELAHNPLGAADGSQVPAWRPRLAPETLAELTVMPPSEESSSPDAVFSTDESYTRSPIDIDSTFDGEPVYEVPSEPSHAFYSSAASTYEVTETSAGDSPLGAQDQAQYSPVTPEPPAQTTSVTSPFPARRELRKAREAELARLKEQSLTAAGDNANVEPAVSEYVAPVTPLRERISRRKEQRDEEVRRRRALLEAEAGIGKLVEF